MSLLLSERRLINCDCLNCVRNLSVPTIVMTVRPIIQKIRELLAYRKSKPLSQYDSSIDHQYLQIAFQYYVAGRSAYFAYSVPVVGNLFHHSVEMFLKFLLVHTVTFEHFQRKYGHNLNKLWRKAKKQLNDPSLDSFDGLVSGLNDFEELRYPGGGYGVVFSLYKPTERLPFFDGTTKQYNLCLEDIDEFVSVLISKAQLSPGWLKMLLNHGNTRKQWERDNKH